MKTARQRAIEEQLVASDPAVSAFVEASAGSGKTKLLTDRILRLMLAGAPPDRIQCLTFTKAAAAEMSLRLQERLGAWATADDARIDAELQDLSVRAGPAGRQKARQLFAELLDLPGGMRIGTIHAFCQSLLRRFPLEAAISPHFQLVEDADARLTMEGARDSVLEAAPASALQDLAGLATANRFGQLVQALDTQRDRVAHLLDGPAATVAETVRRTIGVPAQTDAELVAEAVAATRHDEIVAVLRLAEAGGSDALRARAAEMLDWLAAPAAVRAERWDEWHDWLVTKDCKPRQPSCFADKKLAARHPDIHAVIAAEQNRVLAFDDRRRALRLANATIALLQLASPMLRAYAVRKGEAGMLDYADLIGRTSRLLEDPGAAWVLYKLDGGIDHLLLDEVQDTAPDQWKIAHRLTEEFFAGLGARADKLRGGAPGRTFFAVGDPKQSIYSFQGADPNEFTLSRDQMRQRVMDARVTWKDVTLEVSFRSTAPVLALVDAVFADPAQTPGVGVGPLHHFPDRVGAAGRVELWPLAPTPPPTPAEPWTVPDRNLGLKSAPQLLADAVASWVADAIQTGATLPSRGRALEAGDVLILVRRRTDFARNVVRSLKARGVPVAGLDRLELTEQAAVQDVLGACDAVLLPQDDLSVACVLTSPLGGLDDDDLMALRLDQPGHLWDALRTRAGERPHWQAAWAFLSALQARADHVTPHALLAEALGPLGGRARLLARLGPEAAEPLDELLGAALSYTRLHAPSLQGFVHWLRRSGAVVKREAGGAGGAVRVMTVHGAKGLQAPLVILPDTTGLPPEDEEFAWSADPDTGLPVPLWVPRKELRCTPADTAIGAARARRMQEYNRLLYVALTRAEDRLVVCGWKTRRAIPDTSWYRMVERGFHALGATREPLAWEWGDVLVCECAQTAAPKPPTGGPPQPTPELPAWAGRPGDWRPAPPPPEPPLPVPIAPSRPEGVTFGPVPASRSPLAARATGRGLLRGTLVHELLQHLPAIEASRREAAARAHLGRHGLAADEVEALAGQALAVLRHSDLAPLFGPRGRSEQPITGLTGAVVVTGKVDRMAVLPDQVLIADYKTGRAAPASVAATPVLYLRQLAAYRAILQAIYPDRPVRCVLVWTEGATVAPIPPALLDAHAPSA